MNHHNTMTITVDFVQQQQRSTAVFFCFDLWFRHRFFKGSDDMMVYILLCCVVSYVN